MTPPLDSRMRSILDASEFWQQVRNAPPRLLGLDDNGIQAPFAIEPMHARPLSGVADLLRNLTADGQATAAHLFVRPMFLPCPSAIPKPTRILRYPPQPEWDIKAEMADARTVIKVFLPNVRSRSPSRARVAAPFLFI